MHNVCSSPTRWLAYAPFAVLLSSSCAGDSEGVSYKTQIRPLLQARCVLCHYEGGGLDLKVDPFRPEDDDTERLEGGLFAVENTFFEGHGGLQYNVVPYDPDASFLIQKLTDRTLVPTDTCSPSSQGNDRCPSSDQGIFMPPRPPPATD